MKPWRKILIIKIGDLGDVALALSLVKAFEQDQISWICGSKSLSLLESIEKISSIFTVNEEALLKGNVLEKAYALLKIWKHFFLKHFDIIITAHKDPRYKLISLFCFTKKHYFFQKTASFPLGNTFHGQAYLDLVKASCPLEYPLLKLSKVSIDTLAYIKKPWIVLNVYGNPKNNKDLRYWDIHSYVELAKLLSEKNTVILIGDTYALKYSHLFHCLENIIDLIDKTNLAELLALLQKSYCIITHDSGPLHLARVARCCIAALFGPTDPQAFSLRSDKEIYFYSHTPCSPCYDGKKFPSCQENKCLKTISAKLVYASLKKHFKEIC
jgi:heptosyltransferase-2